MIKQSLADAERREEKGADKALLALWLNKTLTHPAKYRFSLGLAKVKKTIDKVNRLLY